MQKTKKKSFDLSETFGKLLRQQLFIPIVALLILAIFNLIADPSFYKITFG